METVLCLPSHILKLIREYSCPLTRPDWRTLHKLTNYNLFHCISYDTIPYRLLNTIHINIQTSDWFCMYSFIELWGPTNASIKYGIPKKELIQINGFNHAINSYVTMNELIRELRD
jgi:hypothetical protein